MLFYGYKRLCIQRLLLIKYFITFFFLHKPIQRGGKLEKSCLHSAEVLQKGLGREREKRKD